MRFTARATPSLACVALLLVTANRALATDVRDHRGEDLVGPPEAGYTFCGREGDHCKITGTANVAFGGRVIRNKQDLGPYYVFRYGVTVGMSCKADYFPAFAWLYPGDTLVGKACFTRDVHDHRGYAPGSAEGGPPGYTWCAYEGQHCQFRGWADMAIGDRGGKVFAYREAVSNGFDCAKSAFSNLPTLFYNAACFMKPRAAPTPIPPTPKPANTPSWQQPQVRDHR